MSDATGDQLRVLVVEDSPTQALSIQAMLRRSGYDVEVARNGREGLLKIHERVPAVVLTDLIMPEMDGLQLVKTLQDTMPALPVILMTGGGSDEIAAKALRAGAVSYVPKQKSIQELIEIVQRVIVASRSLHTLEYLKDCLDRCLYRFVIPNELPVVVSLTQYVRQLIQRLEVYPESHVFNLVMAFEETLLNALYHGNLELPGSFEKMDQARRREFIEQRSREAPYCNRRIQVDVDISPEQVEFTIRDEGPGFNPSERFDELAARQSTNFALTESVRGLFLIHIFMDEVEFNEQGNEVRLLKHRVAEQVPV